MDRVFLRIFWFTRGSYKTLSRFLSLSKKRFLTERTEGTEKFCKNESPHWLRAIGNWFHGSWLTRKLFHAEAQGTQRNSITVSGSKNIGRAEGVLRSGLSGNKWFLKASRIQINCISALSASIRDIFLYSHFLFFSEQTNKFLQSLMYWKLEGIHCQLPTANCLIPKIPSFRTVILILMMFCYTQGFSWGFFGHKLINKQAVFCLPGSLAGFYKDNIDYITDHAIDPDSRRYIDPLEAPRHYIDMDHYELDSLLKYRSWKDATRVYSEDSLSAHGIVPWHIQLVYSRLTKAFSEKDKKKILKLSADLGHYIADAHVPLHTTSNYNGQKTGQRGIHGFWESRLPELFSEDYDFLTGRARYIENPSEFIWKIVLGSFAAKDSVLMFEAALNKSFDPSLKYGVETRGSQEVKTYSFSYSKAYNEMLNSMVERRMKAAIYAIGCFWYSAWVDAGQPDMESMGGGESLLVEVDSVKANKPVGKLEGHED